MSASTPNAFLNIDDAHLRVTSGNVYAQGLNISGISFSGVSGLQTVTNTGNVTTNTLEFKNGEKAFVATSNVEVKGSLDVANVATIYNGSNADYDQKQKFTSTVSASGNYFSNTLAASTNGLYAIVGAHGEDKAYTFTRSGSTWTQENIFSSTAGSAFGYAVDISSDGTYAIVGGNGSASVFYRSSGSTWDSGTTLTAGGISVTTGYGASVSISDDGSYAIVGATGQNAAYIFRRTATTTWDAGVKIALTGFTLGFSVAISGDGLYALLGAHAQHTAYVFKRTGAYIWSQQVKITESDSFGYSVALSTDGSRALIGATGGNGKAYSYERSGSDWSQNAIITASDAASGDAFGSAVSLSSDGSYALIGAPGNEKAYTFKNAGTVWTELGIETASDATAGHVFGRSVSISGDGIYALVGASGNEAAYSYERKETLVLDVRGEANVRTLNVSDDLTSNNLTVTGNLNVTTIRSDSNVVAEYTGPHDGPLRKYPEVVLTADDNLSTSGYKASVSSLLTGNNGFRAFDATGATSYWHSQHPYYTNATGTYNPGQSAGGAGTPANGTTLPTTELISGHQGEWIKLQMPKKIKLEEVRVYASNRVAAGTNVYQMPKDIAIAGSNDGTNWYLVDSGTLRTGIRESYGMTSLFITTSSYYSHLALIVKSIDNQGENFLAVEIANIEYYGREEGSASLDTTLKTVYNVPATTGTQLKVYYDGQDYGPSVPTSITDKTGNGNNTTTVGSGIGFNSTYKAFTFDGTSNGKIVGTHGLGTGTGIQYSMSLWFKADVLSGNHRLATFGTQGTQYQSSTLLIYQNDIHLDHWLSEIKTTSDILVPNVWYHLVAIHTGPGTEDVSQNALYLNGVKLEDVTTGGSAANGTFNLQGTGLTIGADSAGTNPFDGSIANFRLYSKALNAGQVQELYDYQKDYFLGSKSQVTLYKGHLGIGVTEPSGQLELAGDERIQEYPPGPMSDFETYIPEHGVFCAYSSPWSTNNNKPYPWKVFNKETSGNKWWFEHSHNNDYPYGASGVTTGYANSSVLTALGAITNGIAGHWIQLKLPYEIKLKSYALTARTTGLGYRMPQNGIIFGSNDGHIWTQIHNHVDTGDAYVSSIGPRHFNVDNTSKSTYRYFRMATTKLFSSPNNGDTPNIGEIQFFGTPGPTTLDKGSLTLRRSLDVPRISRYDVDTETPRPEKLVVDFDTAVNSSPIDISGKGNHGKLQITTYIAPNKSFDVAGGASALGSYKGGIEAITSTVGNGPLTVSFWVKYHDDVTTNGHLHMLFLWGHTPDSGFSHREMFWLGFQYYGGEYRFRLTASGGGPENYYLHPNTTKPEVGRWYHYTATQEGTLPGGFRFYIDGEELTSHANNTTNSGVMNLAGSNSQSKLRLGYHEGSTTYFDGEFSQIKAYNVALEPSEVKKLYNLGRTGRSMVITDTAVGIGKVPEAQLDVRGNLNVDGIITSKNFMFHATGPTTVNQQSNTSNPVTTQTYTADFSRILLDYGSGYDTTNKRYTVPCSGYWEFDYNMLGRNRAGGTEWIMGRWVKNNSTVDYRSFLLFSGTGHGVQEGPLVGKIIDYFNKGDTVGVNITFSSNTTDVYMNHQYCHFYGKMLH